MKEFIAEWKMQLSLAAIAIYVLVWYLIYWATNDLTLSVIITVVIVIADLAVLAYIFREELQARFGTRKV